MRQIVCWRHLGQHPNQQNARGIVHGWVFFVWFIYLQYLQGWVGSPLLFRNQMNIPGRGILPCVTNWKEFKQMTVIRHNNNTTVPRAPGSAPDSDNDTRVTTVIMAVVLLFTREMGLIPGGKFWLLIGRNRSRDLNPGFWLVAASPARPLIGQGRLPVSVAEWWMSLTSPMIVFTQIVQRGHPRLRAGVRGSFYHYHHFINQWEILTLGLSREKH